MTTTNTAMDSVVPEEGLNLLNNTFSAASNQKEWFSAKEISGFVDGTDFPRSKRKILARALRHGYERREVKSPGRTGLRFEFHIKSFPPDVQRAILLKTTKTAAKDGSTSIQNQTSLCLWNRYARVSERMKSFARARLAAVQRFESLLAAGVKKTAAIEQAAGRHGVSLWTLKSWLRVCAGVDRTDRLPALLPEYSGCTATAAVSPEAWDFFLGDYLRFERPTASACYERLMRTAAEKGWTVPSLKTLERKLHRELSPHMIILAREGSAALECRLPSQRRDHSVFAALDAVNSDGHRFDLFCKFPGGAVERPVGVFWADIFSGKILSFRVGQTENAHSILLAFGDLIERFGVPRCAFFDNSRSYASKWLTGQIPNRYRFKVKPEDPAGVMKQLGVEVHWCRPYSGRSKPIERAFRDLCEYVSRHPAFSGAYCGNRPDAKPEDYGSRAVPIEEFSRILTEEIAAHNSREGRRSAVCQGRSFDAVFDESYSQTTIRKVSESQRHLWLLAAEGLKVSQQDGSISLAGNRYHHPALARFMGRKVIARFDPDRLHESIFVFNLAGGLLAKADCIHAAGFADMAAAKEHARQRRSAIKHEKKRLAAERRMRALDVARMLPHPAEPEAPAAKAIQPLFKRTADQDAERRESAFAAGISEMRSAFK